MTWACDMEDVSEPQVSATWVREISKHHAVTLFAVSRPDRFGCVREQFADLEVIEWRDMRVPVQFERFRSIVNPGYALYYRPARRLLKTLVTERRFDVIHHLSPFTWRYPSPIGGLGLPAIKGPVGGGLPTPSGLSGDLPSGRAFMALRETDGVRRDHDPQLRGSFRRLDHLLLAAPYVADLMGDLVQCDTTVETELGLTADQLPPPSRRIREGPLELLFVGRVVAVKGVRYAIEALARIRFSGSVILRVVGDGEDLPACRALAGMLGVSESVEFAGWLPREEIDAYYARAHVFVFPSVREPSGIAVIEAMAHGLPVITCNYGGPAASIDDRCGFRVTTSDREALVSGIAHAVDRLAESDQLRSQMGFAARARAVEHFGWSDKLRRIDNLYERVVTEYRGSPPRI